MDTILNQFELNSSLFTQIFIFGVTFVVLKWIYFKPFLHLIEARHQSTIADKEAATTMIQEASAKMSEYNRRLLDERQSAKKEFDHMIEDVKREENRYLSSARDQAKKITQETAESLQKSKIDLRSKLEMDVESLARGISEKLLSRKV